MTRSTGWHSKPSMRTYTPDEVQAMRRKYHDGATFAQLSEQFGTTKPGAYKIVRGHYYKNVPGAIPKGVR